MISSAAKATNLRMFVVSVCSGNLQTTLTVPWVPHADQLEAVTSTTASAKACGASWGRLCPMPPSMVRCEYAGEHLGVGGGLLMRRTVGITLHGDRGHADDRTLGQPLLQIVVLCLALGETLPPAIVVYHDRDMIGIVEGLFRRSELPDQLREIVTILVVAGAAALGREIELIPPLQLGLWRQRHLAGFLAADQIAAHRNHGLAALWPERRHDVGRPRAPVETGKRGLVDLERVHQRDGVDGECRRLAVAERVGGQEARGAVTAQIWHDDPKAG